MEEFEAKSLLYWSAISLIDFYNDENKFNKADTKDRVDWKVSCINWLNVLGEDYSIFKETIQGCLIQYEKKVFSQ